MVLRSNFMFRGLRFYCSRKTVLIENATGRKDLVHKVAVTSDGKMAVGWHPDVPFPYEFSKPIPQVSATQSASLFKDDALTTSMSTFKEEHPELVRQQLMKLTHTTKHRWFPRARDKRAKINIMDRPFL